MVIFKRLNIEKEVISDTFFSLFGNEPLISSHDDVLTASNINTTLSSSFDNLSCHGDATFPSISPTAYANVDHRGRGSFGEGGGVQSRDHLTEGWGCEPL